MRSIWPHRDSLWKPDSQRSVGKNMLHIILTNIKTENCRKIRGFWYIIQMQCTKKLKVTWLSHIISKYHQISMSQWTQSILVFYAITLLKAAKTDYFPNCILEEPRFPKESFIKCVSMSLTAGLWAAQKESRRSFILKNCSSRVTWYSISKP